MTIAEKIEMYKSKQAFVNAVSKAFEVEPRTSSVDSIELIIYKKELNNTTYFEEFIVVHFFGGAISVRRATGNSCTANFRTIGSLIDGGYYDEVGDYETLEDRGFERVTFI